MSEDLQQEMPERIFCRAILEKVNADGKVYEVEGGWTRSFYTDMDTQYVRADLYAKLVEEYEALDKHDADCKLEILRLLKENDALNERRMYE